MARASTQIVGGAYRDVVMREARSPAYQAYQVLHWGFVALPVIAGLDKFAHLLVDWNQYLAPGIAGMLPVSANTFMIGVGVIEIAVGLLVAIRPRIGALVVAAWMAAIIVNLLLSGSYFDIALRDFGLGLAAIALSRLALDFDVSAREREAARP